VINAADRGEKFANGLTIDILPGKTDEEISEAVDIAIVTDMGNARNKLFHFKFLRNLPFPQLAAKNPFQSAEFQEN
jgi:hypothetical protein